MNPGRELDALVAEKVMGLSVTPQGEVIQRELGVGRPRHYSTDIESAWLVVEKLQSLMPDAEIRLTWSHKLMEWECRTWDCDIISASAPTAPHAVTLLALKALGAL